MMKLIVCVKVINGEINPFDESALECALSLSDDVTVVSMGPKSAESVLQSLTRLGAKVILISDKLYAGSDTLATAYILSETIKKLDYDLILCGRQSVDGDTAQVGPMLSAKLGVDVVTNVITLDKELNAKTRLGEVKIETPSVVTIERGYYLRLPSIFSKLGEVAVWDNTNICCDVSKCGLDGSPTRVLKTFQSRSGKRKCQFINMSELIPLVKSLREQDFQKTEQSLSKEKLKSVWAIGEKVLPKAQEIADDVVLITETEPEKIAEMARVQKPSVILWNADTEGRKNAPIVAAMLDTGLCADCTSLEADGEKLIMYRPAKGGDITAKIKCITSPQMATVRTENESTEVIVSGGKGVRDSYDKLCSLAQELNAELAASRGLVDTGMAPYEHQIGLTGKMVSPKVYIAVGISGAVHHTCAIEGADVVIAINPDKNARIFEYSDYGILSEL